MIGKLDKFNTHLLIAYNSKRRWRLIKEGKACEWRRYRSVDDAIKAAGLDDNSRISRSEF